MDYVISSDGGYLTTPSNPKLAGDLAQAGHCIFEVQSVSEALYFCETVNMDGIVIVAEIEDPDVVEAHLRRLTIKLRSGATAKELIDDFH